MLPRFGCGRAGERRFVHPVFRRRDWSRRHARADPSLTVKPVIACLAEELTVAEVYVAATVRLLKGSRWDSKADSNDSRSVSIRVWFIHDH